jgi:hypothetical protein
MINPDGVIGSIDGSIFLRERGAAEQEDMGRGAKKRRRRVMSRVFCEFKGVIHPTLINKQSSERFGEVFNAKKRRHER